MKSGYSYSKEAMASSAQWREASQHFNKTLSKEERKRDGVFFTPIEARKKIFDKLDELGIQPTTILEPSFGSGEFLLDVAEKYPDATIFGVELNKSMYDKACEHEEDRFYLTHGNFLEYEECQKSIDLVIGNPPYFVVKDKNPECMTGRGNIFVQFIYKCITQHLSRHGVLAFVLPTSFYNCSYYEPCRQHIYKHCSVLHVETIHVSYYDTSQDTMILILRNKKPEKRDGFFVYQDHVYLTPFAEELTNLVDETNTLSELGFEVKTGTVVWNQHKEKLSDDAGTILIYSSNIRDETIVLHNLGKGKKQFVKGIEKEPVKGPAILVSRGYGNTFSFNFALVEEGMEFFGENHVNMILPKTQKAKRSIPKVLSSFRNEKTHRFIEMFVGNGALSKTELETILPIFGDE